MDDTEDVNFIEFLPLLKSLMRIVLIADVYPPLRSSGAVQLRDLAKEFVHQGHKVMVLVASPDLNENWSKNIEEGILVVRLKSPKTKDAGYVRRTIGEFLMPFFMLLNLRRSGIVTKDWDGVVWYSPTIFLGPIVNALKKRNRCPSRLLKYCPTNTVGRTQASCFS